MVFITEPTDRLQKWLIRGDHAAFSLNRLHDYGTNVLAEGLAKRFDVVKGEMIYRTR